VRVFAPGLESSASGLLVLTVPSGGAPPDCLLHEKSGPLVLALHHGGVWIPRLNFSPRHIGCSQAS